MMTAPATLPLLHTARMVLTPCQPQDCADFIALEQDPEVMRFLNGGRAVDRARCTGGEDFLMPDGTETCLWTARRKADGAFVGWFCLWPDSATCAELGYRLRRAEWGQGLASEGARALVQWGLQSGGYDRIFASTMTVNHASRRVMAKAGLAHVRTFHTTWPEPFPGTEDGLVEYEVRRPEAR
jgi:RimJ/RimL family protein N-acetyltransferase